MVEVVAAPGFEDSLEGHGAALRMGYRFCHGVGNDGSNEEDIPAPDCGAGVERFSGTAMSVGGCEGVLIVGLNDVMRFCNGLAQAICEGNFGVGQMAQNVANGPFWGRRVDLQLLITFGLDEVFAPLRCGSNYRERAFLVQER